MKKIFMLLVFLGFYFFSSSQIIKSATERIKNRVETKVNNKVDAKVNEKIDQAVDTTIGKVEKIITDITTGSVDSISKINDKMIRNWRDKLLNEGQWDTDKIGIDLNTGSFTSESMNLIQEMALLLYEKSEIKLKIIGLAANTPADLELAQSLSASIRSTLTNQYSIEPERLINEFKIEPKNNGEKPRVRFIKLK